MRLSLATCKRHAATGSGRSRRTAFSIAFQRASMSGSPKTWRAHAGVAAGTIVQLTAESFTRCTHFAFTSLGRAFPTRSPGRSASKSGSGSPDTWIYAPFSASSVSSILISHGAE